MLDIPIRVWSEILQYSMISVGYKMPYALNELKNENAPSFEQLYLLDEKAYPEMT